MGREFFLILVLCLYSMSCAEEVGKIDVKNLDFSLIGYRKPVRTNKFSSIPIIRTTKKPKIIACGAIQVCANRLKCINGRVSHNISYAPCEAPFVCCDMSKEIVETFPIYDMGPCGFGAAGSRANREAIFGEFPWMVAILEREITSVDILSRYIGGGSIIAPTVVLTSVLIVDKIPLANLWVRAGEYDHTQRLLQHPIQQRSVNRIISHEYYQPSSLINGTALLILESPFSGAAHIRPICLPILEEFKSLDKSRCIVTGWGSLSFQKFDYQTRLKKLEMSVLLQSECNTKLQKTRLGPNYKLDKGLICAGGEENVDACQGDGGSPLICPLAGTTDRYFQVGIVAWGIGCGTNDVPGAYVDVVDLLPWLNEKLNALNINRKYYTQE